MNPPKAQPTTSLIGCNSFLSNFSALTRFKAREPQPSDRHFLARQSDLADRITVHSRKSATCVA